MQNSHLSSKQPPIQALAHLLNTGQIEALAHQAADCAVRWPNSGPVWHLLGLAHLHLGQANQAIDPLTRASKLMPKEAQILEQLGIALMQAGQSGEAYRTFERCLALTPNHPGLLINLAHLANERGNHTAAERHCQRVLRHSPGQPEALFNLGRAMRGLGRRAEALTAFRDTLARASDSPVAQNDIGLQLQDLGANLEAETCFRRAIALAPGYARAHSNLGRLLQEQGKATEALACFRQAAALEPDLPAVYANMGSIYNSLRQFTEGEAASRRAITLDSRLAAGFSNLANALVGQKRFEEAETHYRQALAIDPDSIDARNNFGNLLQEVKRYDEALPCYRRIKNDDGSALGNAYHCSAHLCDWSQRERDEQALRAMLGKESSCIGPFGLLSIAGEDSPELQKCAGRLYAQKQFRTFMEVPPLVAPATHPVRDRLRIGYLSADFHNHATMHLLGGVLASHDRTRFSVHLYSYGPNFQDSERQRALDAAESFHDLGNVPDDTAAKQIAADGIDILVDLKGYTQDARLGITALRPAPVIVSWLGYPGTLGHERLADYIIGDPTVTPPEYSSLYTEILALMPSCYQPNDRRREIGRRPSRTEAWLPEKGFVFCSFNQSYKFTPQVFTIWCRLLREIPGSVLWLLNPGNSTVCNLQHEAKLRGVEPERLVFADKKPLAEHLGRLQLADLALDTYPYGSHTTGSDALWTGVPLLTRSGNTFASRVGASLLHAVDLPELIAGDWENYFTLALALANEPARLAAIRDKLVTRRMTASLFDTEAFTRNLERLYKRIWDNHGHGQKDPIRLDTAIE